jgi:N-carbamoyl-L-amino-acid hydrolase
MSSEVLFTPVAETTGWRINGERLWDSLMALAEIGATPKGGCCRLTLTDLDRQGRDLVIGWAQAAGMSVTVDKIGNVFMRREGRNRRCRRLSPAAILIPSLPAGNLTATTACWRRWRWCVR